MTDEPAANPLLAFGTLPRYDQITPEHVVPAVRRLLGDLQREIDTLESKLEPSWAGVVEPLESIADRLAFTWGIVSHLMGVRNCERLRQAQQEVQPEVVAFGLRQGQSRPLYDALCSLQGGPEWERLGEGQRRIVTSLLRDARHAGVGLAAEARERFNEIQAELARLGTEFSNHVLDATKAFSLTLRDPAQMEGAPESLRQLTAQAAHAAGEDSADAVRGPWRISLDQPCFVPFMEHVRSRALREQLYRAYITRASQGEFDNSPGIERILALRLEAARLLGFASYAELSLDGKMAPSVAAVEKLLEDLRAVSYGAAQQDLAELQAFAAAAGAAEAGSLRQWDVAYWSERLREARFAYSEEELRPYFPLPRVLAGLFDLAGRLFGIRIRAADGEAPVWHADVRFFRVEDESGEPLAAFFLDAFSRPGEKRGGAWMDECLARSRRLAAPGAGAGLGKKVRLPVAHLVCNQAPPVGGKPSLMSFEEVTTLFHEFGHGLQHMLTEVDHVLAAGIHNIEWDAVELPSQFMENWCYQRETLLGISAHVETGEPLPEALFEKIRAARTFRAGSDMLRQIYFAATDLALHHRPSADGPGAGPGESAFDVQRRIAERTTVMAPLPEDRFLCSFGHIFAGGYAAGYYSYKWAEVLSADAFEAFEEAGLSDARALAQTGRRFRHSVLALGGSRDPMQVFSGFRGRAPRVDALLRHSGLAAR